MKVGTDGVLLGAWAEMPLSSPGTILDVGTGTGLIALMLAQRGGTEIDAIDLDADACAQAIENVETSPFNEKIRIQHISFSEFRKKAEKKYNLIVSNPPYFSQSLKCPDNQRSQARHDDSLPLEELIGGSRELLLPTGRLALILPVEQEQRLNGILEDTGLFKTRQTNVHPVTGGPIKRILVEIAQSPVPEFRPDDLCIEKERHIYTSEYCSLTRDFYLKM